MMHCPSARAKPGAQLLGVRGPGGRVGILAQPLTIDEGFVAEAALLGRPEARFRFADTCAQKGCAHWQGRCGFGASLMAADPVVATLPACGIRDTCRWHAQHGDPVCLRCPAVVTDVALPEPAAAP